MVKQHEECGKQDSGVVEILVLTHGDNIEVLREFVKYWNHNSDCSFKIVSDAETGYDNQIIIADPCFSNRLIKASDLIETEYVLVLLDDYYLLSQFTKVRLNELAEELSLSNGAYYKLIRESGDSYGLVKEPSKYSLSLGAAIWKKEVLQSVLMEGESAWETEIFGSKRFNKLGLPRLVPSQSEIYYPEGGVLHKGKVPYRLSGLVDNAVIQKKGMFDGNRTIIDKVLFRINLLVTLVSRK